LSGSFFFYGPTVNVTDMTLPTYNVSTPINSTSLYPTLLFTVGGEVNTTLTTSLVQTVAPNTVQITISERDFGLLEAQINVVYTGVFLMIQYAASAKTIQLSYYCTFI
jgi:hypothetical protein